MSRVAKGFDKLRGVTIGAVSADAINEVTLKGSDGSLYSIEAEVGPFGIPFLVLRQQGGFDCDAARIHPIKS